MKEAIKTELNPQENATSERRGDYTLYIDNETEGRKITFIEWEKVDSGIQGNQQLKTFYIKYESAHYPGEYKRIGVIYNFKLINGVTGEITEYKID